MVEVSEKINRIVNNYISDVGKHIKIDKVYLYGSYAKGNNTEYSDLDIAIFSDEFKNQSFIDSATFLFSIARKYKEICIEPIAFTTSDLNDDNPFVNDILTTGKEIMLESLSA